MSALAAWLARQLWGHMLWIMRRPWMKRLQRRSSKLFSDSYRPNAMSSLQRQNRFARRYGLKLLTMSFMLLLGSVAITGTYFGALFLYESGYLTPPQAIAERSR
jgi:hypothetical protein